jgi:predicted TIM-barrel fold metal-dependent hydrolase
VLGREADGYSLVLVPRDAPGVTTERGYQIIAPPAATARGRPAHAAALAAAIPDLKLIACHFGGYHRLAEAEVLGRSVMVDTSWPPSVAELRVPRVRSLIERHGSARVVFGSDWPMADMWREVTAIREFGLTAGDEAAVLGGTLLDLLTPAS